MTKYQIFREDDGEPVTTADGNKIRFDTEEEAGRWIVLWDEILVTDFEIQAVEQDDETTDDDNTTMAYDSIIDNDEESENNNEQSSFNTYDYDWGLGDHSTASDDEKNALSEALNETMEDIDGDIDGDMMDVLKDAEDLVKSTDISRWECSHEDCGLGHSHPDWKHDIRSSHISSENRSSIPGFNITADFAEEMEFCPFCHCGANEAAMLVQFYPYITAKMFKDGEEFDGVLELEADKLRDLIGAVVSGEMTPKRAALQVAESRETAMFNEVQMFLNRVQQMQSQANKAPIAQETRAVIEANRGELEAAVSE